MNIFPLSRVTQNQGVTSQKHIKRWGEQRLGHSQPFNDGRTPVDVVPHSGRSETSLKLENVISVDALLRSSVVRAVWRTEHGTDCCRVCPEAAQVRVETTSRGSMKRTSRKGFFLWLVLVMKSGFRSSSSQRTRKKWRVVHFIRFLEGVGHQAVRPSWSICEYSERSAYPGRKNPEKWRTGNWFFHHNNARPKCTIHHPGLSDEKHIDSYSSSAIFTRPRPM